MVKIKYLNNWTEIIHGNCFDPEIIAETIKNHIHFILVDIPFNLTQNKWDKAFNLQKMWDSYMPMLWDNSVFAIFTKQPFTTDVINSNREYFRYELIWEKDKATMFFESKRRILPIHENILIFSQQYPTNYYPQMKKNLKSYVKTRKKSAKSDNYGTDSKEVITTISNGERYPTSILKYNRDHANQGIHPTQKPRELEEILIKSFTKKNETVLDFCMGSGTTPIASLNTQRNSIGIELNKIYFNKAEQRIKRFTKYHKDEFWKINIDISKNPITNYLENKK